jgi:DNA mismatch repair protein MutS
VPPEVLRRAEQLLAELESSQGVAVGREASAPAYHQLSLFRPGPDPVIQEILPLDPFRMTPLEALNKLYELRERIRREGV